jgi:hypothetical protein
MSVQHRRKDRSPSPERAFKISGIGNHFGLRRLGAEDRAQDLAQEALVVTPEKLKSGEVREPERVPARTTVPS